MSSQSIRRSNSAPLPESLGAKKPAASVKEAPVGDFVSIQNPSVLLDKLEEIANLANEATGADGVAIALLEGDQFLCRASLGFAPEVGVAVQSGEGVCGQCLAESRLVLAQDLSGEVKSALAAPVVIAGKVRGLIAAFSFRAGAFAASHSELLCCLASDIAQGLDALDAIRLVTRESPELASPKNVRIQPTFRDERLAVIDAVTSPVVPLAPPESRAAGTDKIDLVSTGTAQPSENPGFHFLGYRDGAEPAIYDSEEDMVFRRPFRSHWDIVIILAAVLIAVLTFGIWLRHRHNQPYTGQLAHQPAESLVCATHVPTLVPVKVRHSTPRLLSL